MIYAYDPSEQGGGGEIRYVHNLIKHLLDNGISTTLLGVKLSDKDRFADRNFSFLPAGMKKDLFHAHL